jgi:hypothetical protein
LIIRSEQIGMAAMAARTVSKRIVTSGLVDTVSKVPARMQVDDSNFSTQIFEVGQVKPSKQRTWW